MVNREPIAILLATYNGEKYVGQQIQSILDQNANNWVLYVSDDQSTDATASIVAEYSRSYPAKVVFLGNKSRFGNAKDHFLSMMGKVESNYYMFSDQDDVWLPHKVSNTYRFMNEMEHVNSESPKLVHTDLRVVSSDLIEIDASFESFSGLNIANNSLRKQLIQNCVTGCTMMINKQLRNLAMKALSHGDMSLILMHDWLLAIIAYALGEVKYSSEVTMLYRQHGNNSVGAKDSKSLSYILTRLKGSDNQERIRKTMMQVSEIVQLYSDELGKEEKCLLTGYADLLVKSKMGRLNFYFEEKVLKHGLHRILGQILWG